MSWCVLHTSTTKGSRMVQNTATNTPPDAEAHEGYCFRRFLVEGECICLYIRGEGASHRSKCPKHWSSDNECICSYINGAGASHEEICPKRSSPYFFVSCFCWHIRGEGASHVRSCVKSWFPYGNCSCCFGVATTTNGK